MSTLDYQSPQTTTPRNRIRLFAVASILVAFLTAPLPLFVLVDMNRECIRTSTYGEDSADRITFKIPTDGLTVPPTIYFGVRYAVFATPIGSVLLLIASIALARSARCDYKLYAIYVIIQLTVLVCLLICALRFTLELNDITAQRDWVLHMSYNSSVFETAMLVALGISAFPAFLIILYFVKRPKTQEATRTLPV